MAVKRFFFTQLLTTTRKLVYSSCAFIILTHNVWGEEAIELEPVVISATRLSPRGRTIPLRSRESLLLDGYSVGFSLSDILERGALTDVRSRGPYGVQADISLRGAPFEENLILLDGVSLNDPQTGHHNMNIPLTMHDVERVDVIYGPSSSVFGSAALGGAVNIIPKLPEEEPGFSFTSATGSWDHYSESASFNIPLGAAKNRSSVEWRRSTGYAPETEFDTFTASSHTNFEFEDFNADLVTGYLTKRFGAASFYSDRFPNEEERINTGLLIAKAEVKGDDISLKPSFYWKRLQDSFELDRNRRGFSRNDHTTNMYGAEISGTVDTLLGRVAVGASLGKESIKSTNLGDHSRIKESTFLEYEHRMRDIIVNCTLRLDHYSTFKTNFSPSLAAGYEITDGLSVRAGAERAFRAPTFTDLYYTSAANMGNPGLKPETAWTYEAGCDYLQNVINASATVFLRQGEDMIDWTRDTPGGAWTATNIGEFDMCGMEALFEADLEKLGGGMPLKKAGVKYSYLESLEKKGIVSKYVLEYLRHNLNVGIVYNLPFGFTGELDLAFRNRIGHDAYFLLDSAVEKEIAMPQGRMTLFLRVDNILNTAYMGQGDIKMPPRGIFGGLTVDF